MKDEEQRQLVERIQTGDAAAEKELFVKYKETIFWKICRSLKSDIEDINDVASEIYLAMLQGIRKKSFDPQQWQSLDAFVWGVTNNKIRDWFKKTKREKQVFDRGTPAEEFEAASEEYLLENEELRSILRELLDGLDTMYKEVLDFRYFQELSVQEISKKIGIAPRRVSERIHYALKLMRNACTKSKIVSIFGLFLLLLYWYE